jgi:hypothetical protein
MPTFTSIWEMKVMNEQHKTLEASKVKGWEEKNLLLE